MQIFGATGEPLGSIGTTKPDTKPDTKPEPEQAPEPEPAPAQRLLLTAKPSVSLRRGVAWVRTYVRK